MGPVQSVEDGNANLTIVADVEGLAWFTADKGLLGSCITVSIAGHRRNTGTRVHLPLAECDAWIEAILGGSWITHVYRAGNKVEPDGRLDIASYRLFLDERRNPCLQAAGRCRLDAPKPGRIVTSTDAGQSPQTPTPVLRNWNGTSAP
jgi:hypothetical protein